MRFLLSLLLGATLLLIPAPDVHAQESSSGVFNSTPPLNVEIPTLQFSNIKVTESLGPNGTQVRTLDIPFLSQYIASVYKYAVGVSGIIAIVMMMIGGMEVMLDQRKQGFTRINNALVGLALTLGTYIILFAVNPDLVSFKALRLTSVKNVPYAGCQTFTRDIACGQLFEVVEGDPNSNDPRTRYRAEIKKDGFCAGTFCAQPDPQKTTRLCDTRAKTCIVNNSCKQNADICNKDTDCCSNYCVSGKCSNQSANSQCRAGHHEDCKEGRCITQPNMESSGGRCSAGELGAFCGADRDCVSGLFCMPPNTQQFSPGGSISSTFFGKCVKPTFGGPCFTDANCNGTQFPSSCVPVQSNATLFAETRTPFKACATPGTSIYTVPEAGTANINLAPGEICSEDSQCFAKGALGSFCLKMLGGTFGSGETPSEFGVCVSPPMPVGGVCKVDDNCVTKACVIKSGSTYGTCSDGAVGSPCDSNNDCKPGSGVSTVCALDAQICVQQ